ncbi:MAG: hypothetical protein LBM76_00300 [Mycoplasmataceae bacterium]|nr:hypothetical protein [Mycoplasmataceae bacterium]
MSPAFDYRQGEYDNTTNNPKMLADFATKFTSYNFANQYMWSCWYIVNSSTYNSFTSFDVSISCTVVDGTLTATLDKEYNCKNDSGSPIYVHSIISTNSPAKLTDLNCWNHAPNATTSAWGELGSRSFHIYSQRNSNVIEQDTDNVMFSVQPIDFYGSFLPQA